KAQLLHLSDGVAAVDQVVEELVDHPVLEAQLDLVGLAGPEVGRGRLFDDVGWNADHVRELPDLRLVQVAEWIDGAGKVTVDGSVSEQELGFIARPQD